MGKTYVAPLIARHFSWLLSLGYRVVEASERGGPSATYERGDVLVRPSYEYLDEYADITIARRQSENLGEEPYWAQVHLDELLRRRAPSTGDWRRGRGMDDALASGAHLLRAHAADLLAGEKLDVLDDIVTNRPHHGVPGLDFPVAEPWAFSREGLMFPTHAEMPRDMADYIKRTKSADPTTRAVGALKIPIAARGTRNRDMLSAGHQRLHQLLGDPVRDVRRAAASALGEWGDRDALYAVLTLLEDEPGDSPSPIAAAATFIAIGGSKADRGRTLDALDRFAARGDVAAAQVRELAWRLGAPR